MFLQMIAIAAGLSAQSQEIAPSAIEPRAAVDLYGARAELLDWPGYGDRRIRTPVCLMSSTGRGRLSVRLLPLDPGDGASRYEFKLTDATGIEHTRMVSPNEFAEFNVNTGRDRCLEGANAAVELTLRQDDAIKMAAGEYRYDVSLVIEPN